MSGFTTTGASILTNIDAIPHGILLWRNLMQWLGGMGIIILSLAIFPALGIGSFQLLSRLLGGVRKNPVPIFARRCLPVLCNSLNIYLVEPSIWRKLL